MAWETRYGRGRYYSRSRRQNGRVVREYIGRGPAAELAAEVDWRERDERETRRRTERQTRQELTREDAPVKSLHDDVETVARCALLVAGFHCHRGEWRMRRG